MKVFTPSLYKPTFTNFLIFIVLSLLFSSGAESQNIPASNDTPTDPEANCFDCTPVNWNEPGAGTPDMSDRLNAAAAGAWDGGAAWTNAPLPLPPNGHNYWITLRDIGTAGTEENVFAGMTNLVPGNRYRLTIYHMSALSLYSRLYIDSFEYQIGTQGKISITPNPAQREQWETEVIEFTATAATEQLAFYPGTNGGGSQTTTEAINISVPLDSIEDITDSDGDGIPDLSDVCSGFDDTADNDNDTVPDGCDDDDDNDGILDADEGCVDYVIPEDFFVPLYHANIINSINNNIYVTGQDSNPTDGTSNYDTFQLVTPGVGDWSAVSGTTVKMVGADDADPQFVLLTTTGLYVWGNEDVIIDNSVTNGTDIESLPLPTGVSAAQISYITSGSGVLAFITTSGTVYTRGSLSRGASSIRGGSAASNGWYLVETSSGTLTGVVDLDISNTGAFAVTSSGDWYTWGPRTFLGNTSGEQSYSVATLMTKPVEFSSTSSLVQIEITADDDKGTTLFALHSNGNMFALGENDEGQLGQGNETDSTIWVKVKNAAGTGDLENVVFIAGQSYSALYPIVGAITKVGNQSLLYLWGENRVTTGPAGNMISDILSDPQTLPGIPAYDTAATGNGIYADVNSPSGIGPEDRNPIRVGVGGHLTIYYDTYQKNYCFVGHDADGAFGNGGIVVDGTEFSTGNPSYRDTLFPPCTDTDGDGIPDSLDLDSDNDGCSDAIEAGTTTNQTTNYQFPSNDVNGSGVPNTALPSNSTGDFQNAAVNSCVCPFASGIDTDNDTIDNTCDQDDDNDGILDINEANCTDPSVFLLRYQNGSNLVSYDPVTGVESTIVAIPAGQSYNGIAHNYDKGGLIYGHSTTNFEELIVYDPATGLFTSLGTVTGANFESGAGAYYNGVLYMGDFGNAGSATGASIYAITLSADGKTLVSSSLFSERPFGSTVNADWGDIAIGFGCNGNPTLFGAAAPGLVSIDLTTATATGNIGTFITTSYPGQIAYSDGVLYGNANSTTISSIDVCTGVATTTGFTTNGTAPDLADGAIACYLITDTDNDGTPDYLDTDSDGDGCFDAIEGAGSFTSANVDGDGMLTGSVDANGIPTVASAAGQAIGDSQNAGVQDPDCINPCDPIASGNTDTDGDGVSDVCDDDDDNDGILDSVECLQQGATGSGITGSITPTAWDIDSPTGSSGQVLFNSFTFNGEVISDYQVPVAYNENFVPTSGPISSGEINRRTYGTEDLDYTTATNWNTEILPTFQSNDMNLYQDLQLDLVNDVAYYELKFDPPIVSKNLVYALVFEKSGNNEVSIEALDHLKASLGSPVNVDISDYIDTGSDIVANGVENLEIAVYPVDNLAPVGEEIHWIRVYDRYNGNDAADGKVFVMAAPNVPINCIDTDDDGTPDYLDADSDGDGCNDADEAYNNSDTDLDNNGYFGSGTPTVNAANGRVSGASYATPTTTGGGLNTFQEGMTVSVTTPPANQTVCETGNATFQAEASATAIATNNPVATASTDVIYQWYVSTDTGTTFNAISGQNGTVASGTLVSLVLTGVNSGMNNNIYKVIFTNEANICGDEAEATLTVSSPDDASFNYDAASYCVDASDPTPIITGVAGGTFTSAPAGLSITAATGVIDVSASTPGTYSVTYTTTGTCPGNSSESVTINALDDASFSYSASEYCIDGSDPTPTITGLAGGTFTSSPAGLVLNAANGTIDVSASTIGSYSVTYTTAGSCANNTIVSVDINGLDDASFTYDAASYCVDASDPTPTITGLAGGTFTSTAGLSITAGTGAIDVSASTPGTYSVTYTTAGSCPNSSNVSVTINALDDASFSYDAASYCTDASDPTPTITGLAGGTFTSTAGLSITAGTGAIDVSASTPGTYSVTYTTAGSCPNSSNVSVTINALDDASFSYDAASYCTDASDPTPTITGLAGGTFSSTAGLTINAGTGAIDVSASTAGTYSVTYTTSGSCANSSNVSVTINALDDASFSYDAASYCTDASDPTPTITGLAGGTFSSTAGLSITAGTGAIDVSASTPGTYSVTYTTAGSCPDSSSVSVTINALDDASFTYDAASYCTDAPDPTPTITGLAGGTFTSTAGLSINAGTGAIDVSASTPGTYSVTYTTAGSCPNSSNVSVTINARDDASFSYDAASYCTDASDPTPTITGLAGGTFTSTAGLSINAGTGAIDVSASTPGTYSVTYTTAGSCPDSSSVSVTINALDDASFTYDAASYCTDASDPTPTITGLAGGTFTSTAGLSINAGTGVIDVSASTPGTYSVTYTTAGSCPNSSSVSVTINALDDASFTYDAASYCTDASDPTPTITGLAGGTFTSTAGLSITAGTGAIDVSASTPGTYSVTYTTAGSCPNSSSVSVTINALDDASFSYDAASYCVDATDPTPTITGLAGGTFTSTAGLSINAGTGAIDVSASTPGTYSVTYTTAGSCPNSSNVSVTINALDDASFSYDAASYCTDASDPTPTITGLAGGTFSSTAGLSINAGTGAIDVSA
ncbi:hypothetical protein BXY75_3340, partial [Ulvibacter antarcticus]